MARNALVAFALSLLFVSGCAHYRDPMPIPMQQAGDADLDCDRLCTEYCSSVEVAAAKIKKNQRDDVNDILLGILIWPGMADLKNADGTEGNALLDRCIWLKNLAIRKECDVTIYPALPERYK